MEGELRKIIQETIDEFVSGVTYDNIKNDTHGLPIVYQLCEKKNLEGIFRNGFSREFAGNTGGNFYCTGLYTTFTLRSTIHNLQTKASLYGSVILKMAIRSFDRFFICSKHIAQQVYGPNWRFEDQLKILLPPRVFEQVKNSRWWPTIISTNHTYTSANVQALHEALGGMMRGCDANLNKYNILGFVFKGSNDGEVAIIRDFKAIIPIAYSLDGGKTFRDDLFNENTLRMSAQDFDPIIFLGADQSKYINPRMYRVINGYMKVQRKDDWKYNFIDANTKEFLSPIWFDEASNFSNNGKAFISLDGDTAYVGKGGFYGSETDDYPEMSFEEMME